jgi:hypothetical protein
VSRRYKNLSRKDSQVCEKCNDSPGTAYTFYYGKLVIETRVPTGGGLYETVKRNYDIAGSQVVLLCSKCILRSQVRISVLVLIFSLCFAGFATFAFVQSTTKSRPAASEAIVWGFVFAALSFLGIIWIVGYLISGRKGQGEKLAIILRRDELEYRGFNTFWTVEEYSQLKTNQTIREQ